MNDLLWILAVLAGWLAIGCLIGRCYSGAKFRTFLKATLSDEVEHLTHVWETRVNRWTALGFLLSGLSILCIIAWSLIGSSSEETQLNAVSLGG
jgi:hypothetical protein